MSLFNFISMAIGFAFAYKAIATLVRKKLRATLTAMDDIPLLGIPRKDGHKISGTAVICGGSVAGLLSARVCSDHFENVVMIEPEEWITTAEGIEKPSLVPHKRSHVYQYTAFHGFQSFMTLGLRKLFPNVDLEMEKGGDHFISGDAKLHASGVPITAPRHKYTVDGLPVLPNQTRAGLETLIRRLVLSTCPNVRYITGAVTALIKSEPTADTVDAVRIRSREGEESTLPAALVVDCTGPALGGLRWLQNLSPASTTKTGKQVSSLPLEALRITYDPKMSYTTCAFDVPQRLVSSLNDLGFPEDFDTAGFLYVSFPASEMDNRHIIIARKGSHSVQIACGGWDVRERITSTDDIRNFLSHMKLSRPLPEWILSMVDLFEEERVPSTYVYVRCPASVYVQYHLAENLPSNFIALGDSVLQLNPVRGHGCTKACVEAVTLNGLLTRCASKSTKHMKGRGNMIPKDFSRKFFSSQAKRTGALWKTYKSEDYAWKTTTPEKGDILQSTGIWRRVYGSAFMRLATKDREVASALWHTSYWLAPPTDMFSPIIVLKLAWMQLQGYLGL